MGCHYTPSDSPKDLAAKFAGTAFAGNWKSMRQATIEDTLISPDTGIDGARLRSIATASVSVPAGITPHPRIQRAHIEDRKSQIASESL